MLFWEHMEAPDSAAAYAASFPASGTIEQQIAYLLTSAIRAPSTHNSQPWLFQIQQNTLYVYRNIKIQLPNSDSKGRYAHVSIGFLLHHIAVLAAYSGMTCIITPEINDEGLIAKITLCVSNGMSTAPAPLAEAIFNRRNRRGPFTDQSIPNEVLEEAKRISSLLPSTFLTPDVAAVQSPEARKTLAELTAQNMHRVYAMPAFRAEMSRWITPTGSPKRTGLPGYTLNQPVLLSWILPTIIRFVNMGPVLAKLNYGSLATANAIFGFGCGESPLGWVSTGFQASHSALTLIAHNFDYSVFVASVEYEDTREKATETFGLHQPLQFLFAAGKIAGSATWRTPRIPISKKMIRENTRSAVK